jgi:uncharacterized protein YfaS (alpha-2-macroglobulin family)
MTFLRLDRTFRFAAAFLCLNACGWWWVKQRPPETARPGAALVPPDPVAEVAPVLKPFAVVGMEQVALTPERLLTLAFTFTGPVEWPSFAERLKLTADGQPVAWQFVGKNRARVCQVQTKTAVRGDRIDARVEAGVKPASGDYAALAVTVAQPVPVIPEFQFSKLEAITPSFGQPYVSARFTQMAEAREAASAISCDPPVPFTVTPESWGDGLRLTGSFAIGTSYTFTFKPGLRSRAGHRLEQEVRRTVLIRHREPSVTIPVEGRYLAPDGELLVPVLAVNTPRVESRLARVLPQNLVQYALREGGHTSGWWRDEPAALAQELTTRAAVRTNAVSTARDQEQRLLLRLGDYGQEPVRGVYVLEVSAPEVEPSSRLVCVTDLGLSARGDDEAVTVWVTALRTGLPVPGARVELYGRNNLLWAQGVSDAQGLVRLKRRADEGEPFLVLAQTADGRDLSMLQLADGSAVEQRCEAARGYPAPGVCEAFLLSDRDLYRHGESVFVQALLRQRDGKPPAPFPVELRVVKPDGRTFKASPLMPDALGAAVTQVSLPEYLPSGTYTLELRLPGEGAVLGERRVMLEAFVPPQIRVRLKELPTSARAGDELTFHVAAEHLFGKPAAGLGVQANLIVAESAFAPKAWEGFLFGDPERSARATCIACPSQTLTADGTAAFHVKAAVEGLPPAQLTARVQATVTETGGRTVSARGEVKVDPYPFYIGICPNDRQLLRAGVPHTVTLAAVNPDGTRHGGKTPLKVRLEKVAWVSGLLKTETGGYRWESEQVKTTVAESTSETGPEDTAYAVTAEGAGDYVLTFTDPVSHASSSWRFATGGDGQSDGSWSRATPDRVELVFDKADYRSGDTARLQLRTPFAGQAWVSLCSDRLLENRVVTLTNNTASLEWAVTEAFAPNVAVAVSVVRPAVAESVWSAHRASGEALLRVLPQERKLTVQVQPDTEVWRPKSKGTARVTVTDAAGRPARGAEVTVLAVDEGVCLLTDFETPDPYGFFTEARWGGLTFHDVYRSLMPITSERLFGSASHIGGDGGDEMLKRLNPVAARRFKPLALWQARLKADEAGGVTVPFELPEFAGELRLMAVAWDAQAVGSAAVPVKVKRELVVQPDLPRFLAPGDQADMQVALHNESGGDCAARVSARAEGPLTCDTAVREVELKAGESLTLQLALTALGQAGTARIFVRVEGAGEVYDEPVELAVRPASARRVTSEYVVVQPGEERSFEPPREVLAESFSQTFFCSAQPSVNLLGALDYVASYPHGCLEQAVSSVLPLLTLGELAGRLPSKGNTLAQEAPGRINAALLRVLSMQRWNGFALWPDVFECSPQATVYAAFFLAQASQAGYAMPKETLPEVLRMLRNRLPDGDEVSRAYVCHVLALAGQPDHGWMLRLYEQAESLRPEERFHLARALILSGEVEKGRELLTLARSVKGLREAAFALLAWLEIDPANPFVAACCQEIDQARRREGHWGSTQDNALALLALGTYARQTPERPQTFAPVLQWAGQSRDVAATNAFTWAPGAEADRGAVRLRNGGPGPMHVMRRVSRVPLAASEEMTDSGLKVRRTWLDAGGMTVDPAELRRGDLVIVRLVLDPLGRTCKDVVVEELLPAGLEVESARMDTDESRPWIRKDESAWVLHREVRDDRLLLFSKAFSTIQCFHYAARVVSSGEFVVPAVSASAMYEPDFFSRHGVDRITVP